MKLTRALALTLFTATLLAACASPKQTTVEGYSAQNLNRKRIAVLLPAAGDVTFANADLYGSSRGVAGASAAETFESELRTMLLGMIQDRLDSNSVLNYAEMPVAGIVPLSATSDFTATGPVAWESVKRAGQEGAIDFLLVLRDIRVENSATSDPRGDESLRASYSLLDIGRSAVVTSGTIDIDVPAPRMPATTHEKLATSLTAKLPFTVVD